MNTPQNMEFVTTKTKPFLNAFARPNTLEPVATYLGGDVVSGIKIGDWVANSSWQGQFRYEVRYPYPETNMQL